MMQCRHWQLNSESDAMKFLLRLIVVLMMVGSTYAQSNLPACPSSGYFHNCFGTFTLNDGDKYVGEVKDNKFNGQGTYTYASGNKYVGEFKDGNLNGQGTYTFADGYKYVGEFTDGKPNRQGTETLANGTTYVGEFKDGTRNGQFTVTYANGDKYVGWFKDGEFNGQGAYTYANGDKYVGWFKDGEFNGQGAYTYANGDKYVGEFKDDKRNGQFTVTFANGHKYVGEITDGKFNGQGTYTFADGNKYVGEFTDGKRNRKGILYLANGRVSQSGIWSDDSLVTAQYVDPDEYQRNIAHRQESERKAKEEEKRQAWLASAEGKNYTAQQEAMARSQAEDRVKSEAIKQANSEKLRAEEKAKKELISRQCETMKKWGADSRELIGRALKVSASSITLLRFSMGQMSCLAIVDTPKGPEKCRVSNILQDKKSSEYFAALGSLGAIQAVCGDWAF